MKQKIRTLTVKTKPTLEIDILTLFPKMFIGPFRESMIRLAKKKGLVKIQVHDLRKFAEGKHRSCDDKPFGGGAGMVMMIEPIFKALDFLKKRFPQAKVIYLSPQGCRFTQEEAWKLSRERHLIFLCGHYEGVDERVRQLGIDLEVSIGDFITTGGELPAMCVVDSLVRLVPGVVGNQDSVQHESFQRGLLDYPHYTRPRVFHGMATPEVLLSGNHDRIAQWRKKQAHLRTKERRPDLLERSSKTHEKPLTPIGDFDETRC